MAQIVFSSNDANGAAVTFTGTVANVKVYKDGSTTERASASGMTLNKDFDGITGSHLLNIDLSDNTDAGFWASGSGYTVLLSGITVDSKTVNVWIGSFRIGSASVTVSDKTGFALTGTEHTNIAADCTSALTAQGYTSTRAGYLDTLNGLVVAIWASLTSGMNTVGSIGKRLVDYVTGDTYARIGSPAGATLADDVAAVKADTGTLTSRLTNTRATNLDNLDAAVTGVPAAVWANSGRTLTAFAFNVTVQTNNDKTGYALTTLEHTSIANEVEAQIIDDTDSERVLTAITDKIAAANPDLSGLTLSAIASAIRTELAAELARIDAAITSRAAADTVAAIKDRTDNLPDDPASQAIVVEGFESTGVQIGLGFQQLSDKEDALGTLATAIKNKTDDLPADPLGTSAFNTAVAALNDSVNTRLAADDYVAPANDSIQGLADAYEAPDNLGIAAIKERTDRLPDSPAATGALMTLTPAAINAIIDASYVRKITRDPVTGHFIIWNAAGDDEIGRMIPTTDAHAAPIVGMVPEE
jgi:hypothetical protein